MRKNALILILAAIVLAGCIYYLPYDDERGPRPPRRETQPYDRGYDTLDYAYFYDYLGPYGAWIRFSPHGYVWIPRDVGYRWRPYSRGHWVWTDYGWHWVSSERWGWLVFHYGRWGWERRIGWYWVPDDIWGPAWVMWRSGDFYLGWAPIPPGIDLRPGYGYGRWNNVRIPGDHWNFVHGRNFMDRTLDRWILPYERNITIINMTVINTDIKFRGNRAVNEGMGIEHVRRVTNRTVDKYELKDARRAEENRLEGREVVVFRPEVSKSAAAKPREYLEKEQAETRLERGELGPTFRPGSRDDEVKLRESHERESVLLRESQEEEISLLRRNAERRKSEAATSEEKKAVEGDIKAKIAEADKKHEKEKAELSKRQKEEETKVTKTRIKKKD